MTITATYKLIIVKHVYAEDNEEQSWEKETDKFITELEDITDPLFKENNIEDYVPYGCKYYLDEEVESDFD